MAAQAELQQQIDGSANAAGEPNDVNEARAQLSSIAALQRSIAAASASSLPALQSRVNVQVAVAHALSGSLRNATPGQEAARAAQFAAIDAESRRTAEALSADLYERRIFDKYLTFDSTADEIEYRKREAENQRYIRDQLAQHTPVGNLNANGALAGQMLDAHAHGAGESPDFASRWQRVTSAIESQRQIVQAQGLSTEEFDRNLAASVRRYLKTKGFSDEEITAQLAADADPLNAVRPYMKSEEDAKALSAAVSDHESSKAGPAAATNIPKENVVGAAAVQLDSVVASLRSAGATAAIDPQTQGHGLTIDRSQRTSTEQSPG